MTRDPPAEPSPDPHELESGALRLTARRDRLTAAALLALLFAVITAVGEPVFPAAGDAYRSASGATPLRAADADRRDVAAASNAFFRGCRPPSAPSGGEDDAPGLAPAANCVSGSPAAARPIIEAEADTHPAASGQFSGRVPTGPPAA